MTTLLNLSGGIDSTYCLVHHLRTSKDRLLIHHCKLVTGTGRHEREQEAVAKILEQLKTDGLTRWTYIETTFDYDRIKPTYDSVIVSLFTCLIAKQHKIKYVIRSANKDDMAEREAAERQYLRFGLSMLLLGKQLEYTYPIAHLSKQEVWEQMEDSYKPLVWWCRKGGETPCNSCRPCKQMKGLCQVEENKSATTVAS